MVEGKSEKKWKEKLKFENRKKKLQGNEEGNLENEKRNSRLKRKH